MKYNPILICNNEELIKDIHDAFAKHGLRVYDTFIEIEDRVNIDLQLGMMGHKMCVSTILLGLLDND